MDQLTNMVANLNVGTRDEVYIKFTKATLKITNNYFEYFE